MAFLSTLDVKHIEIAAGDKGIYQTCFLMRKEISRGRDLPLIQTLATGLTKNMASKTDKSKALTGWVASRIQYREDLDMSWTERGLQWIPLQQCPSKFKKCEEVEMLYSVSQVLKQGYGDCLPGDTLLLTPIGFKQLAEIQVGDIIMGDGEWTKVTNWWDKGILPILQVRLSSGSFFSATPEHRVFYSPRRAVGFEEIPLSEVKIKGRFMSPKYLVQGKTELDPDMAWLLGVYVADGWTEYNNENKPFRLRISGKDGFPKEKQKKRVQEVCKKFGFETNWQSRFITIKNPSLAELTAPLGRHSYEKHLPTLDYTAETARSILEGLASDASHSNTGTLTYNTTSSELALQIRVLHRMLGEKVNIHRVDVHGGLGTHPIYRIGAVRKTRVDGKRPWEKVTVRFIEEGQDCQVFDIETESHRFYLPEHDIIVHNCDDFVMLLGALHEAIGIPVKLVVAALNPSIPNEFSHVYLLVETEQGWIPVDAINKANPWGWEAPNAYRREIAC